MSLSGTIALVKQNIPDEEEVQKGLTKMGKHGLFWESVWVYREEISSDRKRSLCEW